MTDRAKDPYEMSPKELLGVPFWRLLSGEVVCLAPEIESTGYLYTGELIIESEQDPEPRVALPWELVGATPVSLSIEVPPDIRADATPRRAAGEVNPREQGVRLARMLLKEAEREGTQAKIETEKLAELAASSVTGDLDTTLFRMGFRKAWCRMGGVIEALRNVS